MQDTDDSPWDDSPSGGTTHAAEAEWTRLSSDFQNAGYREGITAGKERALQEGFDKGFALTGAPLGRELGLLRGLTNALLLHLSQTRTQQHDDDAESESGTSAQIVPQLRELLDALAAVRFADIAPPPPPPPSHVHVHVREEEGEAEAEGYTTAAHCVEEDVKSDSGGGEEESSPRSAGFGSVVVTTTTTTEDVRALRVKLETLLRESGLKIDLNLEIF